jgi:hypothetical protein
VTLQRLEVADVFQQHGQEFLERWGHTLSGQQRRALRDIVACRTAELGVHHIEQCDRCPNQKLVYNSCRNRHCPKCHSRARDDWLAERSNDLLPVPYCHVVFTMPRQIARLALQNPRILYGVLFRASSEALSELAADPKRLGARIGFLAVLHTWTQRLEHHPHVHCVIPAGGLKSDRTRWVSSRKRFFLPVRPLSHLFRGKFLAYLRQAFQKGHLQFRGSLKALGHPMRFNDWLAFARQLEWVVYAKPPFGGPEHVLKYLARYTHRVAIANGRLTSLEAGAVRFQWRDSQHGNQIKEITLDAVEFIRRFLLHVLPSGFVKIRHFGFLSNRNRKQSISLCRTLLPQYVPLKLLELSLEPRHCPVCHVGIMRIVESTPGLSYTSAPLHIDSS